MCARAINIGHAATNTHPRSNARDVDFDRFGLYCIAPHILFCQLLRFCAILTTSEKLFDSTSNKGNSRESAFDPAHFPGCQSR